ncbi:TPA: hypothetical protein ACGQ50_000837 [Enterobacter cloacae]
MSYDLKLSDRFTLPGEAATLSDIDHAMAIIAGMQHADSDDGRHIYTRHDARHNQDLRYLVLRDDDNRQDVEQLRALGKQYECFGIWTPLRNGQQLHTLTNHTMRVLSHAYSESRAVLGEWQVQFPQEHGDFNRTLCNMKADRLQVGETFMGRDLFEVIGRGILSHWGRYKDVYLYHDDTHKVWRHICLSRDQFIRLVRGQWETFHRRFIWFPSLSEYAYALETFQFPQDAFKRKAALAAKELVDRAKWDKENLRDYLANYRYRDKDVFNEKPLPKGTLHDYL